MKTLHLALIWSLILTSMPSMAEDAPPADGGGDQNEGSQNPFQAGDEGGQNKIIRGSQKFERCQKLASVSWEELQNSFAGSNRMLTADQEQYYEGVWHLFVEGKLRGKKGLQGEFNGKVEGSDPQEFKKKEIEAQKLLVEIRQCAALIPLTSLVDYANPVEGHAKGSVKGSHDGRTACKAKGLETQDYPYCLKALNAYAAGTIGSDVGTQLSGALTNSSSQEAAEKAAQEANSAQGAALGAQESIQRGGANHARNSGILNGISAGAISIYADNIPTTESLISNQCTPAFPANFGHAQYNKYINEYLKPMAQAKGAQVDFQELDAQLQAEPAKKHKDQPSEEETAERISLEKECQDKIAKGASEELNAGKADKKEIEEKGKSKKSALQQCIDEGKGNNGLASPAEICFEASQGVSLTMNGDVKNFMEEQAAAEGMAGIMDMLKNLMSNQQADKIAEAKKDLENMKADPNLAPKLGKFDASKLGNKGLELPKSLCVTNPKDPKCLPTSVQKNGNTSSPMIGGLNFSGGDANRAQGMTKNGEDGVPLANNGVDLNDEPPAAIGDVVPESFNSPRFLDPAASAGSIVRTPTSNGTGGAASVGGTGLPGSGSGGKSASGGGDPSKKANSSAVGAEYSKSAGGAYKSSVASAGRRENEAIDPFKKFREGVGNKGSALSYRGPASEISSGDLFQSISTAYQKANTSGKLLEYVYKEGNEDSELKDPDLGL